MLFSELYNIMMKKVTFVGFRGGDWGDLPPWIRPCVEIAVVNNGFGGAML